MDQDFLKQLAQIIDERLDIRFAAFEKRFEQIIDKKMDQKLEPVIKMQKDLYKSLEYTMLNSAKIELRTLEMQEELEKVNTKLDRHDFKIDRIWDFLHDMDSQLHETQ